MSEVRLVRCPKCDKVLPEPSGYTVYQCGGCGAILRAKKKSLVSDGLLKGSSSTSIFVTETIGKEGNLDMAIKSPARSMIGDSDGSKSPLRESGFTEFNWGLPKSPMRDRFLDDLVRTSGGMRDAGRSPIREMGGSNDFDHDGIKSPARSRYVSKSPVRDQGGTLGSLRTIDDSRSPMREGTGFGGLDGVGGSAPRSMDGDAPKSPLRRGLGSEVEGNGEQERVVKMTAKASFNTWLPDDNHEGQSRDNHIGEPRRTWRDRAEDRPDQISEGVESVFSDEHGMTSEGSLGDSIHGTGRCSKGGMYKHGRSRSDYVGEYARPNVFDGPSKYHPDSIYGYGGSRQSFESARGPASVEELQLERVELLRKYKELKDQLSGLDDAEVFYSKLDGHPVDESLKLRRGPMQQLPPERNVQRPSYFNHGPGLAHSREDMYEHNFNHPGQMKRGPRSNQYLSKHTIPGYGPGRSLDFHQDRFEPHANDTHGHHPACGCSICYPNDGQGRDRHSFLSCKRHGNLTADSISSHSMDLERHGPRAYDPRMSHTSPRGRSFHPAIHHHSKSANIAGLNKRLCRPISGGAPFVLCNNCFQLLKLPGNFISKHKNQQFQCGACSTVNSFDLQHNSSDSLSSQKKPDSVNVVRGPNEVTNNSGTKHHRRTSAATSTNVGSYDFDAGGYSYHSMGSEASGAPKGHKFNSSLAENPLSFTVDEHISEVASPRSSQHNSSEMPMKIRPPPGSPLREHLDFSSQFHKSQDIEEKIIVKNTSREGPLDVCDATETEVPFNELPTSLSQDSEDILRDTPSSIDALLKPLKDITSLSGRGHPGKAEVYVNGQAISQRAVKKAEKLAGKIQPGEYWYDPKAGFWGVMGDRCLGIIPPSIQEFSTPMPENCSRGDSAVYVNGRELHKRDLDLLASRGLPTTSDMRYVVDISGRVLDENTRDFIVNLGRLAPSVERNKCGFGMQVPEQLDH